MPQQTERQGITRETIKSSREVAQARIPGAPATDMLTELRAIRMLLERTFKPPTIQYLGLFHSRTTTGLPTATPGRMILDHDDDRAGVLIFNNGTGTVVIKDTEDIIVDASGNLQGFPLIAGASITLGLNGMAPSNRIFAVQSGGTNDLSIWVTRVDRFPRSTR